MNRIKEIRHQTDLQNYASVKRADPDLYSQIVQFASTFGKEHEVISLDTRYQVERYCMGLVSKEPEPKEG